MRGSVAAFGAFLLLAACGASGPSDDPGDPPEVVAGERLFREGRFAQLATADPTLDLTVTRGDPLPGPYAGGGMNCAACHLVDELVETPGGGVRTYSDFARRSPVPDRGDGMIVTPRNSPALVNASIDRDVPTFFHFDGEFATLEDLVKGTITGRNFGWLPGERDLAVAQVARVLQEDDGSDGNAADHDGRPYAVLLAGRANLLDREFVIPREFQVDVDTANDEELLDAVARLVAAYVRSLTFSQTSPYDVFLRKNGLPEAPEPGESALAYARRLREAVASLPHPDFVGRGDGRFELHAQSFDFGPTELRGLKVFLAEDIPSAGSCLLCHSPPAFTDFRFHNVGVAQEEYDGVHGEGAFGTIFVPDLAQRPTVPGPVLSPPDALDPSRTDLGLWHVFGNDAIPSVQDALRSAVCDQLDLLPGSCAPADLLPRTIAWFKTPILRDLGQSPPFFHTGAADSLEDVLQHYVRFSDLHRRGLVRNGAPELERISLSDADVPFLAAFLRSLNEDYD